MDLVNPSFFLSTLHEAHLRKSWLGCMNTWMTIAKPPIFSPNGSFGHWMEQDRKLSLCAAERGWLGCTSAQQSMGKSGGSPGQLVLPWSGSPHLEENQRGSICNHATPGLRALERENWKSATSPPFKTNNKTSYTSHRPTALCEGGNRQLSRTRPTIGVWELTFFHLAFNDLGEQCWNVAN